MVSLGASIGLEILDEEKRMKTVRRRQGLLEQQTMKAGHRKEASSRLR
jgi:hypothetical protein